VVTYRRTHCGRISRVACWSNPSTGLGIGRSLVNECIAFAKSAGYCKIVLWTNDVLVSARRIYEAAGFKLIKEAPHHSFGHDLVGQTRWN